MKLFFVHEVSYQEKVIFEMHEFPELLALRGHDVCFFEFPERIDHLCSINKFQKRYVPGRVFNEAGLILITPFTISAGILQRVFSLFTTFWTLIRRIRQARPDVIITYAVPTYGLQLLVIGRVLGIPVIYRAIDVSHEIRKSLFRYAINVIEGLVIRFSDFVSCNNSAMQSYVVYRGALSENTEVNYAPIDMAHFRGIGSNQLGDLKEIVFLGTLFEFSGLEEFIKEANTARLFADGYRLSIIGGGDRFEDIKNLIKDLSLERAVTLHGFIPYQELEPLLRNPGIAINPFQKNKLTDTALPHKVIQYAASRKIIVSSSLEGLQGLFDTQETVFWVSSPRDMVNVIRRISKEDENNLESRLQKQDKVFETKLDNEKNLISFESLLIRNIGKKQ